MTQISERIPVFAQIIKTYKKSLGNQSWKLPNVTFWPKSNMAGKKFLNRKLLKLKRFCKLHALYLDWTLEKDSGVIKNRKILKFTESVTSQKQKNCFVDNAGQNIWQKQIKSRKITQEQKT